MSLIMTNAGNFITSHEIILYGRPRNNVAGLVLSDDRYLDTLKK